MVGFLASNLEESENPYKAIHSKFTEKSNWKPTNPRQSLEVFKRAFKTCLLKSKPKNVRKVRKPNLTYHQTKGLRLLSENPDTVIKKADKGSAIIIINSTDYLREGYRQLGDPNFYTKLDHDPTPKIKESIDKTLNQMRSKGPLDDKIWTT